MLIRLAFLPALISFSVLLGWIFQWPQVVAPQVNGPPMVFNSALCLFLLSLSMLASGFHRLRYFQNAWIFSAALSAFSGAQFLFEIDLHIDQVFMKGFENSYLVHPGRMPAASSFCLLFSSLAWGALHYIRLSRIFFSFFSFSAFCAVLFLGGLSIVNALFLAPLDHGWQSFSLIPVHTGASFFTLGFIGLIRSLRHLNNQESYRVHVYGILCGLFAFFLTILVWQFSLEKNTAQIGLKLQNEVSMRTEKMTALLIEKSEEFQKTKFPATAQESQESNWSPPFAAEAVIRLKPKPELIWSRSEPQADRDLALLREQIVDPSHFHFYPNFYYQRARWFAFSDPNYLLIFSSFEWVQEFFPDHLFSHSLIWTDQTLCSNVTGSHKVLAEWKKDWPISVLKADLILQVTPTHRLYNRLSSLSPLLFLLAGVSFSLLVGTTFVGLLYVKRRFLR